MKQGQWHYHCHIQIGVTGQHYTRIFMFLQGSNLHELLPYRKEGQFPGKQLLNPYNLELPKWATALAFSRLPVCNSKLLSCYNHLVKAAPHSLWEPCGTALWNSPMEQPRGSLPARCGPMHYNPLSPALTQFLTQCTGNLLIPQPCNSTLLWGAVWKPSLKCRTTITTTFPQSTMWVISSYSESRRVEWDLPLWLTVPDVCIIL